MSRILIITAALMCCEGAFRILSIFTRDALGKLCWIFSFEKSYSRTGRISVRV